MQILFVCLGNICRSPTAEGVLRRMAGESAPGLDLEVDSAGTANYHVGSPPDERSCAHAAARGYALGHLRARQVTAEDFRRFDLILAMDADNLRDLQAMAPRDSRARLALFMDFAPGAKGRPVPDPYYGGAAGFETVLDLIEAAARGLVVALSRGDLVGLRDRT